MRIELAKINKERLKLKATVSSFCTKRNYHGYPEPTVCFINIKNEDDKILTDHIWFTVGKTINKLNLLVGETVTFEARVSSYWKGYRKDELDYKLSNISKIVRINLVD